MRLPLKPFRLHRSGAATLRRLSAVADSSSPPLPDPSSPISKTLSLLQSSDPSSWPTNPSLPSLLSSLTPPAVLKVTRQLPNYQDALHFFNHLKATSDLPDSIPLAFQAVLEHAMRENPGSPGKLYELFLLSKDQNTPLSVNAATLLIKCFGQAQMLDEMILVFDAIDEEVIHTVVNSVIAGLLRWGRLEDALKLLDEMFERDSCYPPNSNTVGIVLSSILNRRWSGRSVTDEEIHNLCSRFGEHGVSPKPFWLTQIIMRFCRNGECDKAWTLLHEGMNLGSDVEVTSCNALLTGLGQHRDFERMNLLMKEMKEKGIKPDVVTYGIMIKNLCSFRRLDEALEVLEKMRDGELAVEPDVVIYNTLIDGLCKVGRQEVGLKLIERMRFDSKCEPDTVTYNCLIDGFCKAGEIEKGRELFEQMSKEGVKSNVITLNTLLNGMCKHGRVSSAMEFYGCMRGKGVKGNVVTYTILISAFCNANNIDKAMKLFDEMQENGCSPDAVVYYSLISGLNQAGRMDDATFIVSKMKEAGFGLDIVGYNILISGFCRKNKLDKAYKILKDMEKAGMKPDRVTYNTLLSYFCSSGDFTHAHRVMKKMIDDGLTPTVVTYGALIQAYCSNDNINAAMKLFRDMNSSSRVRPNTVIYNMLIDSLCKNDEVEVALSLMDDMKDKGVRPNTTTYNALFKGLQQRNWFEKVLEFMDQMTEQACNPDYITMEILTEWLSAVGETEKLRKFVQGYQVSASVA
ncbi:UNVERIFIED_CONTAM: Pentatricopeptide repeat-containing protein, mitochondrial [Sesamum latifolium]|uniref:Pentatricopeptide repeat-containing protein, mitochondrial n=1 Tax=Sesamum latifolium TaxID=2727402 RepID=A0AAW2YH13_9LAMI